MNLTVEELSRMRSLLGKVRHKEISFQEEKDLRDLVSKENPSFKDKPISNVIELGLIIIGSQNAMQDLIARFEHCVNERVICHEYGLSENQLLNLANNALKIATSNYEKGLSLMVLGRYDEALKAYDKAIEVNPHLVAAWYHKGYALDDLGKHEEALKAYDKAIEINPHLAEAWYHKGNSLYRLGKLVE